jgi:hypothetical protein
MPVMLMAENSSQEIGISERACERPRSYALKAGR